MKKVIDFEKQVSKALNVLNGRNEDKYYDVNFSFNPTSNYNVNMLLLPLVAQGVGSNERLGDRIRVKHVTVEGYVTQTPDVAGNYSANPLRFTLVLDRQTNGVNPVGTDVYDGIIVERMRQNMNNQRRFIILMDEWLTNNVFSPGTTACIPFRFEMDCDYVVEHKGSAGAVASVVSNLLSFGVCARNIPDNLGTNIKGCARVRFEDDS